MEKDHAKRDEYTARCLRRRTSPRPCWIPLAAVDQNYKAEQRFGTSVRDPRRDILSFLLILALSSSRSNGMVSIGFPNTFERSCFSHPALLSPTPRETIRGFAGGVRWRISRVAFLHLLRHVPLEKGGLVVSLRPAFASWRVRRRVENLFEFHASRRVAHVAHAKNRIGSLGILIRKR